MTGPGDDQPLAPRRSLGKTPGARPAETSGGSGAPQVSQTWPQAPPPAPGQYAGAASPRPAPASTIDRTLPVPAATPAAGSLQQPAVQAEQQNKDAGDEHKRREKARPRTVRRAKLRLLRVDPWSVTKISFLLAIAFGIMCVVAVFLIFSIMSAAGLWDSVNATIQGVLNQSPDEAFDINDYVGMDRIMGITMLIAAIDVVLITALATLGAFIYNMAAALLGGVEVILAEDLK